MEKNKKEQRNNNKKVIIVAVLLVLLLLVAGSYAWLRISVGPAEKVNRIKAGSMVLRLDEEASNGISLVKEVPKSYAQGITTTKYKFKLVNEGTTESNYTITLKDLAKYVDDNGNETGLNANNRISDNLIRILILKNGETAAPEKSRLLSEDPGRVIDTGVIAPKDEAGNQISYEVQLWIDSKAGDNNTQADIMSKYFSAQLIVDAVQSHQ